MPNHILNRDPPQSQCLRSTLIAELHHIVRVPSSPQQGLVAGAIIESSALAGLAPSIITYSTVIKAYCASNQLQQAFTIFEDLLTRDGQANDRHECT